MKRFLMISLAATALLGFFAFSDQGFQANSSEVSKAVKGKTIGVSLFYRRDEFYKDLENGMFATAEKAGLKLIMQDADTDPKKQTEQVENFIAQKVDAIALAVTDPSGMIPVIDAANKAGIPVFAFDGGTKDNVGLTSFIGMDNIDAGQKAGAWAKDYIQKKLGGKANVVILDFPQSAVVCGNRVKGFTAVMKTLPGVKIVAQQDGKASRTDSMTVMENILQANPKVDVIFGINDDTCFGAIAALESVQKENVAVISVGWSEELFNKITNKDQYFRASAVQNPYTMGGTTILTIAKYFETKKVPKEVLDKSTLVTPENIAKFDWQSIVSKRQK